MVYHYSSARLEYRAIREADKNFFQAITDDTLGFINSSFTNIHIPNETDTLDAMKYYKEKCLLGVIIWLKHPDTMSTEDRKKRVAAAKEEGKEHMVEMWGEAIGELHMSSLGPKYVQHRNTEVGLDILPEFQGKGYGSEAINWSLDYAFRLAGLHRVRISMLYPLDEDFWIYGLTLTLLLTFRSFRIQRWRSETVSEDRVRT